MHAVRLLFVSCALLSMVLAQSACAQTPIGSVTAAEEIEYRYRTTTSEDPKLCKHLGRVFNTQFRTIWRREPMPSAGPTSPYSAGGKYAFQKIEGIDHDERKTFQMSLSKLPSSPEFDAIGWRETRVITGGPSNVEIPESSKRPRPALIAYVDFDNDGEKDTLIKYGFTEGYDAIRDEGESKEYLTVVRSSTAPVPPSVSLWSLRQDASGRPAIRMNGQYLRPLIHAGRTYVASYEMEFTAFDSGSASPGKPARETMTVIEFGHPQSHEPITDLPPRTGEPLCQFEMIRIK
jgi:hypothetical protein